MLSDYQRIRQFTERLVETLSPEDTTLQSMPDASPAKWHLAHTTWFFETFLVSRFDPQISGYKEVDPAYAVLFNSYYNTIGEQFPRHQRGLISRPTLAEALAYRQRVDEAVAKLAESGRLEDDPEVANILEIGVNHEQQHQELLLTDIKHALSINPLDPVYREDARQVGEAISLEWIRFPGDVFSIGNADEAFAYDNESPRHEVLLRPFELASRPVTCGEYLEFMKAGGYETATLWLAEGWNTVQTEGWRAPQYWRQEADGSWSEFTLAGRTPIDLDAPLTHVSYFEAEAYARWAGCRLPTEAEWEVACVAKGERGIFADELLEAGRAIHPAASRDGGAPPIPARRVSKGQNTGASADARSAPATQATGLHHMLGTVWEWTASPYTPYPGYAAAEGALGEYNGKFMVNQQVLRGGSCATSSDHIRPTYRNFFGTAARWQFSGIRLAK